MEFKTYLEYAKLIIFLAFFAFIVFGGYSIAEYVKNYKVFETSIFDTYKTKMDSYQAILDKQNRQYLQLTENLVRAQTDVVSSLKDEIKELQKERPELIELIKKNKETIKNIGQIRAGWNENVSRKLKTASDHTYKAGTGHINEQYTKYINLTTSEGDVRIAWVQFFPNREPENMWNTGVDQVDYFARIVQAEQKSGIENTYPEVWIENRRKEYKGKKFPIEIKYAGFKQGKPNPAKFHLWAPRFSLNVDAAVGSDVEDPAGAGVSFSVMGYGTSTNDLSWRFIDFGFGFNNHQTWSKFTPAAYNLGKHIPIIENTFLGPFVGYDFEALTELYGIGLSVPF